MGQTTSTRIGYGIILPNTFKLVENYRGLDDDISEIPRYANKIKIGKDIIDLNDYNLLLHGGSCYDGTEELHHKKFVLCRPIKYLKDGRNNRTLDIMKEGNDMLNDIKTKANVSELNRFCKDIGIEFNPRFIQYDA